MILALAQRVCGSHISAAWRWRGNMQDFAERFDPESIALPVNKGLQDLSRGWSSA